MFREDEVYMRESTGRARGCKVWGREAIYDWC